MAPGVLHRSQACEQQNGTVKAQASLQEHVNASLPPVMLPEPAHGLFVKPETEEAPKTSSKQACNKQACKNKVLIRTDSTHLAERCRDIVDVRQPGPTAEQPSKTQKLHTSGPFKGYSCGQEDQLPGNDRGMESRDVIADCACSSQLGPGLTGPSKHMPPQRARSRRQQEASSSHIVQDAGRKFHDAAVASESPANTDQPQALRRYHTLLSLQHGVQQNA